jgi:hypothetical protein
MPSRAGIAGLVAAAFGCGSPAATPDKPATPAAPAPRPAGDPEAVYRPLDVGADYASYRKLTDRPFLSTVHGDRWVDVYVNEVGADAYLTDGAEIPVGTIVVKTSFEAEAGAPSDIAGPIFVMEKRAPGYAPEHGDWFYAIHWADPTPAMRKTLGGPIYWRGASPRAAYCVDCHDGYDRGLGGLTPSSQLPR